MSKSNDIKPRALINCGNQSTDEWIETLNSFHKRLINTELSTKHTVTRLSGCIHTIHVNKVMVANAVHYKSIGWVVQLHPMFAPEQVQHA